MNKETNHLILFSVSQSDKSEKANNSITEMVNRVLHKNNIVFTPALGVTKQWGKERSFLVVLQGEYGSEVFKKQYNLICNLALYYNQEAILYIDNERIAEMRYLSNKPSERLGVLREVPKDKAIDLDNYTMVGEDRYYSVL